MEKWLWAIAGGATTLIVSLIGVVWWMLQKQISLRDEYQADRIRLLRETIEERLALQNSIFERRFNELNSEIGILRKRSHDIIEKLTAIRTVVSHGLLGKRFGDED